MSVKLCYGVWVHCHALLPFVKRETIFVQPAYGEQDIEITTSVWCLCLRRACLLSVCFHPDLYGSYLLHLWLLF